MADESPERNYKVIRLSKAGTVIIESTQTGLEWDTGVKPSQWGDWGLSRPEAAIIHRGLTASGRDKK